MTTNDISALLESQRKFFGTGVTFDLSFRIKSLKALYNCICKHEKEIYDALSKDLGKSQYESFMCEVGLTLSEISYMLKHIKKFSKKQRVRTPISQFPSHSYTLSVPYGNTLIMSPWNYPFLLTVEPLADALAAGNTAILKPSAYAPATADIIDVIVSECFDKSYVAVIQGGREENRALLLERFDLVFFTGSKSVGREVLTHTALHLTPSVLELGGKSPCIIDESADISLAARRVVFGKYLNCGQTCVAPDYILCKKSVKDEFIRKVICEIKRQYGNDPLLNEDYGKIINEKHFDRILSLVDTDKVVYGGEHSRISLKIAPTVMDDVSLDDKVMGEEIFGPLMPVIPFDSIDEAIETISQNAYPLALYIFSNDRKNIDAVTRSVRYGGGCINDVVIHLATSYMGFGGVGESGMGSYHGKAGFDAFSHNRSTVEKSTIIDLPMRYAPYNSKTYEKMIRRFLK